MSALVNGSVAREQANSDYRGFGSDNQSGAHPAILMAIERANTAHAKGYGDDPFTAALNADVGPLFGPRARIYPAFGGTGANVTALAAMCERWQGVLCASTAHITTDEAGALEAMTGIKPITLPTSDGRLTTAAIDASLAGLKSVHQVEPAVLSLTQPTELGTTYSPAELAELADHAHTRGLLVHVDGARLANAAAFLKCSLAAITAEVGIDVVSLGGAKNGMLFGEAIVVIQPAAAPRILRAQKALAQLLSKQRYVSAQLLELFGTPLWRQLADTANAAARAVAEGLADVDDMQIRYPTQANAVFADGPSGVTEMLTSDFDCHRAIAPHPASRIMASWDTSAEDVARLLRQVRASILTQ